MFIKFLYIYIAIYKNRYISTFRAERFESDKTGRLNLVGIAGLAAGEPGKLCFNRGGCG
jgi:hypothetical protein